MGAEERSSLLHDLFVETVDSWRAMSLASRLVLAAGAVGIIVLNVLDAFAILPPFPVAEAVTVKLCFVLSGPMLRHTVSLSLS